MDLFSSSDKETAIRVPLAERMRPKTLSEVVGQEHLLGPGKPLSKLEHLPSLVFWGPPGVGKTTIAKLLAGERRFKILSAVLDGVQELRKTITEFENFGAGILFIDEIHRWNKAQQDSLLPYVEKGVFTLIGATTENPSFSLIRPLLSRAKVYVLKPIPKTELIKILKNAIQDKERGLGNRFIECSDEAMDAISEDAMGDVRKALTTLESAAELNHQITKETVETILQRKILSHDKNGDSHYDLISAFIKSMRGSDPQASIYYLARLLESGEDPKFVSRRMIIFASEDIGLADPRALSLAVSAAEAFDRVGSAEGWIPLSQAAVYLALAPKSNSTYMAYKMAKDEVLQSGALAIPMHIRNAPTDLMKELGYGEGYEYAHNQVDAKVSHKHLPEEIQNKVFYSPGQRGFEKLIFSPKKDKEIIN
ncbi:MAG: replication-associated recombination protein A [Oligoflexia bacterium]|nr:replication-associated recombination protein A [Oligoflexia bacterium]